MIGPKFLREKFQLHKAPEVESAVVRKVYKTGERVSQNPDDNIQVFLDRFSEIENRKDPELRARGIAALKRVLFRGHVIKPEDVPESYFVRMQQIQRERGYGDIEIDDQEKNRQVKSIIADQKSSLARWVDYISSPDVKYPDWLKVWAIKGVLSMGKLDKKRGVYKKRKKDTVTPFPGLNREVLSNVVGLVRNKYEKEEVDVSRWNKEEQEELKGLLQAESFSKMYAWVQEKIHPIVKEQLQSSDGEWVKYPQGSDASALVKSLESYGTGWCTAEQSTAKDQLEEGDFYVFYSMDEDDQAAVPRIAIRLEDNKIVEVRGVADEQNLDPYIGDVLEEKLRLFPDGKKYHKKVADMKRLTFIEKNLEQGQVLTMDELRFIYQLDDKIEGFGYEDDPRIEELCSTRDVLSDAFLFFDLSEEDLISKEGASEKVFSKEAAKKCIACGGAVFVLTQYEIFSRLDDSIIKSILNHDFRLYKIVLELLEEFDDLDRGWLAEKGVELFDEEYDEEVYWFFSEEIEKIDDSKHVELLARFIKVKAYEQLAACFTSMNGIDVDSVSDLLVENEIAFQIAARKRVLNKIDQVRFIRKWHAADLDCKDLISFYFDSFSEDAQKEILRIYPDIQGVK
jgi:hypothetical protein